MRTLARFPNQEYRLTRDVSPAQKEAYLISHSLIARPLPNWELWDDAHPCPFLEKELEHLEMEYNLLKEVYEAGINVPKTEGIFNVTLSTFKHLKTLLKPKITPALL